MNGEWLRHWVLIASGFTESNKLVEFVLKNYEVIPSTIGGVGVFMPEIRNCDVRRIDKNAEKHLVDLLRSFFEEANRNLFNFDIKFINDIQFITYEEQGKYSWHQDVEVMTEYPRPYDRKLSMTIQLSDTDDYEGGDFEFEDGIERVPKEMRDKGSVLIFPSFYKHQITPVTKGVRHALVTWIEGPKWR